MPNEQENVQSLSAFNIRSIPDHPAAELFDREHFAEADAMSDEEVRKRFDARRAKHGLPPLTDEEFFA